MGWIHYKQSVSVRGTLQVGVDCNLYRKAANSLKTDDSLTVAGGTVTIGADAALLRGAADRLDVADGDTFRVQSGTLQLGTAGSEILSRTGAGTVGLDSTSKWLLQSGTLLMGTAADCLLKRLGAATVETDSLLIGTAKGFVFPTGTAAPSLTVNGQLQAAVVGGTQRLYGRLEGTTYYWDKTG